VSAGGSVRKIAKAGGTFVALATAQDPAALAIDGTHAYWTSDSMFVRRAPLEGGTPELIAMDELNADGVAVDGCHVYWVDSQTLIPPETVTGKLARRTKD
jgi:hypothetical protein